MGAGRDTTGPPGATHTFANAPCERGCLFSLWFGIDQAVQEAVLAVPEPDWASGHDINGKPGDGAWVAEITDAREGRIRCAKATGLRSLPCQDYPPKGAVWSCPWPQPVC